MGVTAQMAGMLAHEHRQRPFHGRLLQLGRQRVFTDPAAFRRFAAAWNLPAPPGADAAVTDEQLFTALGFADVRSCDVSDYERPDYLLDLNAPPPLPPELAGQFDVVFDGGTVEHVFDVRHALMNVVGLVKVGGRVIHSAVSSNHPDHGFYMFSPTLFPEYYSANGFAVNDILLFEYTVDANFAFFHPFYLYRYTPGCLSHLSFRGLGRKLWATFFVATKTRPTGGEVVPAQQFYVSEWEKANAVAAAPAAGRRSLVARLKVGLRAALPTPYVRLADAYRSVLTPRPKPIGHVDRHGVIHWR
jgi:hypothetical protein